MNLTHFIEKIKSRQARIGIIGLGYVGLPLMLACIEKKFKVVGFDTDPRKVKKLMSGESYLKHIPPTGIANALKDKMFYATTNFDRTKDCDAILICVPTPLNKNREPDLQYITKTAEMIGPPTEQLIVLESTTYPGTTDGVLRQILENKKVAGKDFYLAFSPEREDPGNKSHNTRSIPKIVGGYTDDCKHAASALYSAVLDRIVAVSSTRVAEMTKLLENIYRSVNIALVNELKIVCQAMDIDIWEVIDAAATKPFGFSPFYPGPGLGGHCIPVDPFYLTWKAREFDLTTRFIELAGEINTSMHHYVYERILMALNAQQKALNGSNVLVLGIAYKKNIDDMRESPALPIIDALLKSGACVRFHDPFVPKLLPMRNYDFSKQPIPLTFDLKSMDLVPELLAHFDAAVIVTDHDGVDYESVLRHCCAVVDCRNATCGIADPDLRKKIVQA